MGWAFFKMLGFQPRPCCSGWRRISWRIWRRWRLSTGAERTPRCRRRPNVCCWRTTSWTSASMRCTPRSSCFSSRASSGGPRTRGRSVAWGNCRPPTLRPPTGTSPSTWWVRVISFSLGVQSVTLSVGAFVADLTKLACGRSESQHAEVNGAW